MSIVKKFTLILLTLISTPVLAEWIRAGSNDSNTLYVDLSSKEQSSGLVKIWSLYDFNSRQVFNGKAYLSTKNQYQIDCKRKLIRTIFSSIHTGRMGSGSTVHYASFPNVDWSPVPPESANDLIYRGGCR